MSEIIEIFPVYKDFLQSARFKVAYGGRGSGKTRFFVTFLVSNCLYYGWRIVCLREIQKSVEDSVMQEIIEEINRRNINEHFKILKSEIQCVTSGGVFKFEGLYRNQQKLKGYSNFDCAWVEEAANVSADSWKFLIPTLRKPNSEILVSFNPESPLDDTYKRFVTQRKYPDYKDGKRYCIVKKINYTENPRFPKELQDDMELMYESDLDLARHVYGGEPVANSDLSIVPPAWIDAAIDIHKYLNFEPSGSKKVSLDVADEGADYNALAVLHGQVFTGLDEWKDKDPNSAAVKTWDLALAVGAEEIIFDAIGVGAGAKGELRQRVAELEEKRVVHHAPPKITAFYANEAVRNPDDEYDQGYTSSHLGQKEGLSKTNKDMFTNLKAQCYWRLRDACYNAYKARNGKSYDIDKIVSFDSESIPQQVLEKFKAEASQPRREYLNGKLRVEPKDKMKRRGVNSPNILEAVIMALADDDGSNSFLDTWYGR